MILPFSLVGLNPPPFSTNSNRSTKMASYVSSNRRGKTDIFDWARSSCDLAIPLIEYAPASNFKWR